MPKVIKKPISQLNRPETPPSMSRLLNQSLDFINKVAI